MVPAAPLGDKQGASFDVGWVPYDIGGLKLCFCCCCCCSLGRALQYASYPSNPASAACFCIACCSHNG
jgi:hypothetical protein